MYSVDIENYWGILILYMIRGKAITAELVRRVRAGFSSMLPRNGKPPARKPFDPVEHGLDSNFVLTNFTKMKG